MSDLSASSSCHASGTPSSFATPRTQASIPVDTVRLRGGRPARQLGVKAFKVASYELWHLPLIREVASRGKPIICSTGMADMADVQDAVDTVASTGNDQLILLHCVVNYPPPFADLNLRAIQTMRAAFGVPVGYSDHSPGITAPVVATALGAAVIEKH